MINEDDVVTVERKEIQSEIKIGCCSFVGTRTKQQDRIFYNMKDELLLAAVCDGMGGMESGEIASQAVVDMLGDDFKNLCNNFNFPDFLRQEAIRADWIVNKLQDEAGNTVKSGTTIVSVLIQQNNFYWMSVGDSKIYFFRNGKMLAVTREHNYKLSLDILKRRGEISELQYKAEVSKGQALISYIGMGNISLIDGNSEAFHLESGDRILLCSDGLYKNLREDEMLSIVQKYRNAQEVAEALIMCVEKKKKKNQDNTSVVVINFK